MGKAFDTTKPPVLLHKKPQYALQLSSIIKEEDYEDLGNHATEVMGKTGLFSAMQVKFYLLLFLFSSQISFVSLLIPSLLQGLVMMKGLMDCCLSHETALERVRAQAKAMKTKLEELQSWNAI